MFLVNKKLKLKFTKYFNKNLFVNFNFNNKTFRI